MQMGRRALQRFDISRDLDRIGAGKVPMKGFFKFLLGVVTLGAVFFLVSISAREREIQDPDLPGRAESHE